MTRCTGCGRVAPAGEWSAVGLRPLKPPLAGWQSAWRDADTAGNVVDNVDDMDDMDTAQDFLRAMSCLSSIAQSAAEDPPRPCLYARYRFRAVRPAAAAAEKTRSGFGNRTKTCYIYAALPEKAEKR